MGHRLGRQRGRYVAVLVVALVAVPILAEYAHVYTPVPAWSLHGGPGVVSLDGRSAPVPVDLAEGSRYIPGTSILVRPDGAYLVPSPGHTVAQSPRGTAVDAAIAESRAWLAQGTIPGGNTRWHDMAERALLDLRALTAPQGGVVAAWHGPWAYVWPRDASFAAAAYCATGHIDEGSRVLDFLARTQKADGTWAARYLPDGRPVADGRIAQLDANGWVPWAAWVCAQYADYQGRHWQMVRAAADATLAALGSDGLPPPSPDYWETSSEVTLGTAAPLLAGLRASADLAAAVGRVDNAMRYDHGARRLAAAIEEHFGRTDYQRRPDSDSGHDAAVTFLMPPFAPDDVEVTRAAAEAADSLTVPNGGIKPGERWRGHPGEAWTPATAFFALAAAASGDDAGAARWLDWLDEHRTSLGALPERVSADGDPVSVAPLSWSGALVLLTLVALDESLPGPPG